MFSVTYRPVEPCCCPDARPAALMVATVVLEEVQVTLEVTFAAEPSE